MSVSVCAGEAEAGLVTKVEPLDGQYYVVRRSSGDTRIDRPIVLRDGDKIHLVDLETRLTLTLIGQKSEVIVSRFNELPYPVNLGAPNERAARAVLSWFIREMAPREQETRIISTNIRGVGAGFSIHLLDKPQRIAAGRRSIVIGWNIGNGASVTIAIRPLGGGKPIATAITTERIWTSPVLDLNPGFYEFEFRSEPFGSREARLVEAIDPDGLPRPQIDRNSQSTGEDLQKTLEAGVMASQGEGAFVLEAFQTVSPLTARLPAARLLQDVLIDGAWTEKPP
jgi:hypothetical protein